VSKKNCKQFSEPPPNKSEQNPSKTMSPHNKYYLNVIGPNLAVQSTKQYAAILISRWVYCIPCIKLHVMCH